MISVSEEFVSSGEIAKRWGISDRRVRILCREGAIFGATRAGKLWKIPATAPKPPDARALRGSGIPREWRSAVAAVDALQRKLAAARPLTPAEAEKLRQIFLVDYTHASTAIEGNTLTLSETAMALEGLTIAEKPLKDHLEAIGHRDAFLYLEDVVRAREPLTEGLVRNLHALVLADQPRDRGVYRRLPVKILGAIHTPPEPYLVAPQMEALLAEFAATRLHPLVAAALFHIRFEAIHPFIDGNGRTGRLLANFILMRAGYLPVNIKFEDRRAYYEAFSAYHATGDLAPMLAIFARNEHARLTQLLTDLRGE